MKRSIELKVKVKSLADEARTIRREERKLKGMARWDLQHHRRSVVRDAARRSLIAYQFIRGRDHTIHESGCATIRERDRREVERMIRKYGDAESVERLADKRAA